MSTHGAMHGEGAGNAGGNDAMSTSGDSVNQNVPRQPTLEDVGGSLAPQDNVLPGVSTYGSGLMGAPDLQLSGNPGTSLVPYEPMEQAASVDGYDPGQSFGSYQQAQESMGGGSVGTAASASVAAAASVLTHAAMSAAQQSAIAGQQAQQATAAERSCGAACATSVQCGHLSTAAYTHAVR